jgi:hypothetical protein
MTMPLGVGMVKEAVLIEDIFFAVNLSKPPIIGGFFINSQFNYMQHDIYTIHLFTEIVNDAPVYTVDAATVPVEHTDKIVAALVYQDLGRAGIKYDYTEFEKRFGIEIDYFKALNQAVDARKQLISESFEAEREKNHNNYLEHCDKTGVSPHQIFIDFPI